MEQLAEKLETGLLPPPEVCERARQARDPRYDGRFFVGVVTTGIYCRPVCPARMPAARNVRFFSTAAAAREAGFRPCLRCRPETAPGSAAWRGTSAVVTRALALIDSGALDEQDIDAFAARLGVSVRHLNRLFAEHVGASPRAVAATRRLHFAKRLIDASNMPMHDVAIASGYGSVRQFNDDVRRTWQRSPRELRRLRAPATGNGLQLQLAARAPFAGNAVLDWLAARLVPGVESIEQDEYRRRLAEGSVRIRPTESGIRISLEGISPQDIPAQVERARKLFDLSCDPAAISDVLARDPVLARLQKAKPGLRIPGCRDPFELAVRCVLGQQVSVKAANTLMHRLVNEFGEGLGVPPSADLAGMPLERIGLPGKRAETVRALAAHAARGELDFDDPAALREQMLAISGIGPWTTEYVCLRAAGDPDAFPAGDLGLRKALANGAPLPERELMKRAEAWRPWRGYAAILLWQSLAAGG